MPPAQGSRKLALGLFHFNVQYVAGSVQTYHRYCTQAIAPFIEVFKNNASFRASFEIAGSGLEFLAKHYPGIFEDLKELNKQGRLELISATYFPSLWVAFPLRDLIKSVEINRHRIAALGINVANIFFAQEAFFGMGLCALEGHFDAVVCKDEFLRHQVSAKLSSANYTLGRMRVIVGANHLINELARIAHRNPTSPIAKATTGVFEKRIRTVLATLADITGEGTEGQAGDVAWKWYHMGSGHHLVTPHGPENWAQFFSDTRWTGVNTRILKGLQYNGYTLSTLTEFINATRHLPTVPLPPVVESGWNTAKSRGVFTWMNKQERNWDQNTDILGLAWRSRRQLRRCEALVLKLPRDGQDAMVPALETLWTKQLLAESSDPCGWSPIPGEVRFGIDSAESALEASQSLRLKLEARMGSVTMAQTNLDQVSLEDSAINEPQSELFGVSPFLIGADGCFEIYPVGPKTLVCAINAAAIGGEVGIGFPLMAGKILFCPSGLEGHAHSFDVREMVPAEMFFPLANGLMGIGENLFLIRINHFGQPAAKIEKSRSSVVFSIVGSIAGKTIGWRFLLFTGEVNEAVAIANKVNDI